MSTPNVKFYNAAIDAAQSGDLPAALKSIEGALVEDPNDVQSWQLMRSVRPRRPRRRS